MNDFKQYFDYREVLVGSLFDDKGTNLMDAAAEITYNRLVPRSMSIRLNHFMPKTVGPLQAFQSMAQGQTSFLWSENAVRKHATIRNPGWNGFATFSEITADVEEFETTWYDSPAEIADRFIYTYTFPLPTLLTRRGGSVWHPHRGFFFGVPDNYDWNSDQTTIKWRDDWVKISIGDMEVLLYSSMEEFKISEETIGFPVFGVATRGRARIECRSEEMPASNLDEELREVLDLILAVISIFEHNRYEWHYEERISLTGSEDPMETRNYYRWAAPHKERDYNRVAKQRGQFQSLLQDVVPKILQLQPENRKGFDDVVHCFILAAVAPTIEVSYLYWHSCIDVILNATGFKTGPFSQRFISACEKLDVLYVDLFPNPTKDEVFVRNSKAKHRFAVIRDQYIHRGLTIDDYQEAIKERRLMSAIAERLLLALIGVDYRATPMGILDSII